MRVLMVNKFHRMVGGSETGYFSMKRLLEQRGHAVIDFAMADERNVPSPYAEYFVHSVNYHGKNSFARQLVLARNFVYSPEAKRKFERLVSDTKPDLIHLHLFHHQLSPSILDVIKKRRLPAVYTAHDLQLLCPNYKMARHGTPCEACLNGQVFSCVRNRCVMDSFPKSALAALENRLHRGRGVYGVMQCLILPSEFYRQLFLKAGYAPERLVHIPNFLNLPPDKSAGREKKEPYILFAGRLSEEKGLLTLLRAVEGAGIALRIAGTGRMEEEIKETLRRPGFSRVKLLGFLEQPALTEEMRGASALVLPSEWYENGPYAAIEALRCGRPLIGSRIGGLPELIQENGILTEPGDAEGLRTAMQKMVMLPDAEWKRMSDASLALYREKHTAERFTEKLGEVYRRLGFTL
ncbi:MAG: glycosyltransferase [Clostridia bacterium]|nr:glycosyltransferase [Clostridia bacterium]